MMLMFPTCSRSRRKNIVFKVVRFGGKTLVVLILLQLLMMFCFLVSSDVTSELVHAGATYFTGSDAQAKAFPRREFPEELRSWSKPHDSSRHFQPIDGREAWIYSAFYVEEGRRHVQAFGIASFQDLGQIFCRLTGTEGDVITTKGTIHALGDHHRASSCAAAITCSITKERFYPKLISVTYNKDNTETTNQIEVQFPRKRTLDFAVCFSPFHFTKDVSSLLVQSIELNVILGAEHFFVYNFTIPKSTELVLQHYVREGLVTVLPWPIPTLNAWYYGQVAAINDCIYRNRGLSQFVVVLDTDEFIIPRRHANWMEMIRSVSCQPELRDDVNKPDEYVSHSGVLLETGTRYDNAKPKLDLETMQCLTPKATVTNTGKTDFGAFIFRSVYFAEKNFKMDVRFFPKKFSYTKGKHMFFRMHSVLPMLNFKRQDRIFLYSDNTKSIVRPEKVRFGGIHTVTKYATKNVSPAYVKADVAMVHHYGEKEWPDCNTQELSALKHMEQIYVRMTKTVSKLPDVFR